MICFPGKKKKILQMCIVFSVIHIVMCMPHSPVVFNKKNQM